MNLNSPNDLFIFNFPSSFVPKFYEDRYDIFLKNYHKSYFSLLDYVNSLIKSISVPTITMESKSQTKQYGGVVNYRGSNVPYNLFDRAFTVKLRVPDFFISYYIIQDIVMFHYMNPCAIYIDNFTVITLDNNRRELFKTVYSELICTEMGSFELAYNSKEDEEKTIELKFKYNRVDTEFLLKYESQLGDNNLLENYSDRISKNDDTIPK